MAVKESFMVFTGMDKNEYSLTPNFDEGIIIKEIHIPNSVNDYLLVYIGKTLVGYYNIGKDPIGNNLFAPAESLTEANVYNYLLARGIFRPYLVAEGETIVFKTENGTNFDLLLVYETHDAGDINPGEPGGSKSEEYDLVNYVYPATVESESVVDTALTPTEFPAFPAAENVPAGREIYIHGIIGNPAVGVDDHTAIAHGTRTQAIKFTYNRKVLFDENKIGIPFYATKTPSENKQYGVYLSPISPCSNKDKREVFLFPEPLVFTEGEELELKIILDQFKGSTIELSSGDLVLGLIETVKIGR